MKEDYQDFLYTSPQFTKSHSPPFQKAATVKLGPF